MSDENFQHELDDELLSAYLDGELTPEERAAVDARLANDPEAQHLLHQLRSVSQAVQMMPLESVGRDLREEIIRRTEAAKPTLGGLAGEQPARGLGDPIPKVTIFQSRRSWIWASLALAAGLLIMVLQSGDDKNAKLPNVVRHDRAASDRRAPAELKESIALRDKEQTATDAIDSAKLAQDERTPPPVMAPAAAPTAVTDLPQSQTLNKQLAAGESAPSRSLPLGHPEANGAAAPAITRGGAGVGGRLTDVPAADGAANPSVVAENSPASEKFAVGVAPGSATASGKPSESPVAGAGPAGLAIPAGSRGDATALIVVHVVAKPQAIRDGAFDQLLSRNGIVVEPKSETDRLAIAEKRGADKADKPSTVPNEDGVDVLLVDAPQETVASCLASLQKDEADYTGVAIEQRTAGMDRKDSIGQLRQEAFTNLSQYSRGIVSEDQKKLASNQQYFDRELKKGEAQEGLGPKRELNGEVNGPQQSSEIANDQQKVAQAENRGRARRVLSSDREGASEASAFGGGGGRIADESSRMRRAVAKDKSAAGAATDEMRVLFVISPDRQPAEAGAAGEKSPK